MSSERSGTYSDPSKRIEFAEKEVENTKIRLSTFYILHIFVSE